MAANEGVEPDLLGATGGAAGFDIPSDKISWPTSLESTGKNADNWCPDQELLEQLTSMGFNKDVAVKALYQTKNNSVGKMGIMQFDAIKSVSFYLFFISRDGNFLAIRKSRV